MQENAEYIKELHNGIPRGWLLFFIGVIAWGFYYIYSFTPEFSGWKQTKAIDEQAVFEKVEPSSPLKENPYEKDPKAVAEGQKIYAENCSACHGERLNGGVGPDLTSHLKYGETDDIKFQSISSGRPNGMPPFEQSLGKHRIWKVLAYVDSVREYGAKP